MNKQHKHKVYEAFCFFSSQLHHPYPLKYIIFHIFPIYLFPEKQHNFCNSFDTPLNLVQHVVHTSHKRINIRNIWHNMFFFCFRPVVPFFMAEICKKKVFPHKNHHNFYNNTAISLKLVEHVVHRLHKGINNSKT